MLSRMAKPAILIALVHMALGCAWHHGLATPHACESHGVSVDALPETADQHQCSGCHQQPLSEEVPDELPGGDGAYGADFDLGHHHHSGCQDDRCSFTPSPHFKVKHADDIAQSLCETARSRVASASRSSIGDFCRSPFATRALGVRAHLILCVQIL